MANFLQWNWASENVQSEIQNGEYVSAESALILAGPSRLSHMSDNGSGTLLGSTNSLMPLGIVQNFSISQNRQVQRLFEIGSKRAYFVPGRNFSQFTMSRILFFGPSLLRLLYALAPERLVGRFGSPLNVGQASNGNGVASLPEYEALFQDDELRNIPGYGGTANEENRDFYANLSSELFNVPFGMCLILKSASNKPYGAIYLEDCYIESHQFGIDSGNIIMAEQVSGQFGQPQPVQLATRTLATN